MLDPIMHDIWMLFGGGTEILTDKSFTFSVVLFLKYFWGALWPLLILDSVRQEMIGSERLGRVRK